MPREPAERTVPADPVIDRLVRDAAPRALGVLLRRGTGFADAEDAVQDAVVIAAERWPAGGVPDRPVGWIVRVAQRRLIARHRSDDARRRREALVAAWAVPEPEPVASDDDPLTLLFLCCHPELRPASGVALTLRAVGGLTTREIAGALLQPEATVAQRISRAKATIARAPEPFRRPPPDLVDARLPTVLQIVYLVFTEAHTAAEGPQLHRADLAEEAVHLARLLHERLPEHPEAAGLLALLLLTDARRAARTDPAGELVPLDEQDRRQWDRARIVEGLRVLTGALAHSALGPYQLQASIAAVHAQAASYATTDWSTVRRLYDQLALRRDDPFVHLNRAIAIAHTDGVDAARAALEAHAAALREHHRHAATLGYLHRLAGEPDAARAAYARAAARAANEPERRFLERRAAI